MSEKINIKNLLSKAHLETFQAPQLQRRMKVLGQDGTGAEIDFSYQVRKFKCKNGCEHHNHLVCVICGRNTYLDNEALEDFQDLLAKSHGFKPQRCTLQIYGYCEDCQ
ncbi:MAG: transcriptional repressor [Candidatus Omnitrophica bacterium]|nr:transcriptional repressor [Candidatus Omnitrophota bacterium]